MSISNTNNDQFKKGQKFYDRNLHYTIFYNPKDNTLNIFYNSLKKETEIITIIINNQKVINLEVKPNHWHTKSLGSIDEINHVRIDNSEKVIYQKSFDPQFKEVFKYKSYIVNEKDS
jgi:hypothetical protein